MFEWIQLVLLTVITTSLVAYYLPEDYFNKSITEFMFLKVVGPTQQLFYVIFCY